MNLPEPINHVLVIDDHRLVRTAICDIVKLLLPHACIHQAAGVREALGQLKTQPVELALIDISLRDGSGYELCDFITKNYPAVVSVALSMHTNTFRIARMMRAGAKAYLSKDVTLEKIGLALDHVKQGKRYIFTTDDEEKIMDDQLTDVFIAEHNIEGRLLEIGLLICDSLTSAAIGKRLNLTEKTVENHRSDLYKRTGTENAIALVRLLVQEGFVPPV